MFAILLFVLYILALIVTNKLDTTLFNGVSWGDTMEDYVASKRPQNVAEAEYWMNQYTRKSY